MKYLEHKITKTDNVYKIDGVLFEYESTEKNINLVKRELRHALKFYLNVGISDYMGNVYTRKGSYYYEYKNDGLFTIKQNLIGRIGYTSYVHRFDSLEELLTHRNTRNFPKNGI